MYLFYFYMIETSQTIFVKGERASNTPDKGIETKINI